MVCTWAVEPVNGSGRHLNAGLVWLAPTPKKWFNFRPTTEMQNEAFSRVLMGRELEFSAWNLLNPIEERFEFDGQRGRAGFG